MDWPEALGTIALVSPHRSLGMLARVDQVFDVAATAAWDSSDSAGVVSGSVVLSLQELSARILSAKVAGLVIYEFIVPPPPIQPPVGPAPCRARSP